MFISKKKVQELEKRIADIEAQVQNQSTNITMNYNGNIDEISSKLSEAFSEIRIPIWAANDEKMVKKRSVSQERKSYDCAVRHIDALRKQTCKKKQADFGEPCSGCNYVGECRCDWLNTLMPILEKSNEKINLRRSDAK